MVKAKKSLSIGSQTSSDLVNTMYCGKRKKLGITEYMIAKLMALYVDSYSEKNMSDEQLELFFKREHIYGKNKRTAYKQFVHNTNYRNVPCHRGSLTILRHHEMDATWSKTFPLFLIKDVRKAEKVKALNGITNTETLKSIWLFSSSI